MPHEDLESLPSMKLTGSEQEKMATPTAMTDKPEYHYGLQLTLNGETLDKLGIEELLPVGSEKAIYAKAVVTAVSQNEVEGQKPNRSMTLQITNMACYPAGKKKEEKPMSERLYGKSELDTLKPVQTIE